MAPFEFAVTKLDRLLSDLTKTKNENFILSVALETVKDHLYDTMGYLLNGFLERILKRVKVLIRQ